MRRKTTKGRDMQKVSNHKVKPLRLYAMTDCCNTLLLHLAAVGDVLGDAEMAIIRANDWRLDEVARGYEVAWYIRHGKVGTLALAGGLWTCDCDAHFIHLPEEVFCCHCGADTDRGRSLQFSDLVRRHIAARRHLWRRYGEEVPCDPGGGT